MSPSPDPLPRHRSGRWRRLAITAATLAVITPLAAHLAMGVVAGAWSQQPEAATDGLGPTARELVRTALADLDGGYADHHVHVVGVDENRYDTWVNPALRTWRHPIRHARFRVYAHAAGIDNWAQADDQYIERFVRLARAMGTAGQPAGRFYLLAFDHHYRKDGTIDYERSEFYVPNERVLELARRHPDLLRPVISVHPYRRDALDELRRGAAAGARLLKWLPSAMGIDPADPDLEPFYAEMRRLDIVLLTHAGEERAVEAGELQQLGNPLRLRRPLDAGVRVIVAHCASFGFDVDLDDPARPRVPSVDLFLRLMDDRRYDGRLFGEISAVAQFNRVPEPLATLLARTDLHSRFVSGSDYPLPAINVIVSTRGLVKAGFITADERTALNEIYDYNPLLFELAVKRTVHHPVTGDRFRPDVFRARDW